MMDGEWVRLLRVDDKVFLIKENMVAIVEMPYYQKDDYPCGKIAIKRWGWAKTEIWHVRPDGTGINGSKIMAPYGSSQEKLVEPQEKSVIITDRWETL